MAALLTRMSSRPKVWSACSTARAASLASATSAANVETRAPGTRCAIAFVVAASASALASTSTVIPPSAQMSSPVAAPMPAPPPVIRAALPSTRFMLARSLGRNDVELLGGGGDARAQRERHFGGTEKSDQPVEREIRIAGLRDSRHIGQDRCSTAVGHRKQLDLAGLQLRAHDRISRFVELNAPGGKVVGRFDLIAIRDLRQVQP